MRIDRLRLLNFRQHESTELEFGAGLTGIVGPNGAGKTTLLEAIAWVMYGMKAARGARDNMRRRNAMPRSRMEVEMEFSLGAHHYRVLRSLNSAQLWQDHNPEPIASSLETVTERITRLLGMTREEFFNTYFTGQKDLAVMASLSAPQRAQFLSRVLGYEKIRLAQDRLKAMRQGSRLKVGVLESALPDAKAVATELDRAADRQRAATEAESTSQFRFDELSTRLVAARPHWDKVRATREQLTTLEGERRVAETTARALGERAERVETALTEARAANAKAEELGTQLTQLVVLEAEDATLTEQSREFFRQREAIAQRDAQRSRLSEIDAQLGRLPQTEQLELVHGRVAGLRQRVAEVTQQVEELRTAWVRDSADAQSSRKALLAQFNDLTSQRERLAGMGREGVCPTCARPLGDEFDRVLGLLDRQVEEVRSNGVYYKRRIDQLRDPPPELVVLEQAREKLEQEGAELASEQARLEVQVAERRSLRAERERLVARLAELESVAGAAASGYDATRHQVVRESVRTLQPLAVEAAGLRSSAARQAELERELEDVARRRAAAAAGLATVVEAIAALQFDPDAFARAGAEEASATAEHRSAELALVRARGERESADEALGAARRRAEEAELRRRELFDARRAQLLQDELDRALSDLRTDLNQQLRPELSEIASSFLTDLTRGRYDELELNENYEPLLLDDGASKPVISGGEEDVANLALRLAISQMIADRAGQPLSLLVLDEIFGSLDEDRRTAVVELLRSLADRFPQVILITHIDSVRDGFDRVIRVGYDATRGVSDVREEPIGRDGVAA
ncbi:MAG TPA: SMC family ATPase [Gemmatimonadales bacterium]|nr:SMC family ATPase [Gemmatimonadales bacterium]